VPSEVKLGIISLCSAVSSYQLEKTRRKLEDKIVTYYGINLWAGCMWSFCTLSCH